jgi:hypothetical protein
MNTIAASWEFLVANPGITAAILAADLLVLAAALGWLRRAKSSAG